MADLRKGNSHQKGPNLAILPGRRESGPRIENPGGGTRSAEDMGGEARFARKSLEQQWIEIMKDLVSGGARWDDSIKGHGRLLEEYKKAALTKRDDRERTTPTFLHTLAKKLNTDEFGKLPEDTLLKIIRYLLQCQETNLAGGDLNRGTEVPVLRVAMEYFNTEFIKCIIKCSADCRTNIEQLIDATDTDGMNCLHYVLKEQLPNMIETIMRDKSDAITEAERPKLSVTLSIIRQLFNVANLQAMISKDKHGNMPIHYALNYVNCRLEKRRYLDLVFFLLLNSDKSFKSDAAQQFNSENESPYLYYLRTREGWLKKNENTHTTAGSDITPLEGSSVHTGQEDDDLGNTPPEVPATELWDLSPSASEQSGTIRAENEETQLVDHDHNQVNGLALHDSDSKVSHENPDTQGSVEQTLAKPLEQSLIRNCAHNHMLAQAKAPLSVMIYADDELYGDESTRFSDSAANEIQQLIKQHYLSTRQESEAKELLYGKVASDKNLYFDASHLAGQSAKEIIDLIEKLSTAGGFEDTLSYVYLPILSTDEETSTTAKPESNLNHSKEREKRGDHSQDGNAELGCSTLISIFDKLASVNIHHILRLQVDDRGDRPHTDAAIERAIRGKDSFNLHKVRSKEINVECWEWMKPDISMDVISFAAPNATHVSLYWSGNQTVLRGWSQPDGISRYSGPERKLRTVTLHAFPGLESRARMGKMIAGFENEIRNQMQEKKEEDRVKIEIKSYSGSISSFGQSNDMNPDVPEPGSLNGPPQQVWIETMEKFRAAFFSIHQPTHEEIPRVKVALIDDGVDLCGLCTYGGTVQVQGLSYYPPVGMTERPWHQSTNGHGTVMANMILRINPWVSLDVMKIHDGTMLTSKGKTRTIYAESAARAIEDAIIRKVDIISISWTIKKLAAFNPSPVLAHGKERKLSYEETAMGALHKAIKHAESHNILMFCSAADDIELLGKESLPFSSAPEYIFRIGAALPLGQRDPTSEDARTISYFFPGNQVAEARDPRSSKPVEYHDGSSVSTALAAGLASLIIHYANIVEIHDGHSQLRKHKNMRIAFDNINNKDCEDKKFLPVWNMFGAAADKIIEAHGNDKKISILKKLVKALCYKLED